MKYEESERGMQFLSSGDFKIRNLEDKPKHFFETILLPQLAQLVVYNRPPPVNLHASRMSLPKLALSSASSCFNEIAMSSGEVHSMKSSKFY